uniref:Reverse transcriptase domain-containing protein n=1 Tax=Tanacetum cinerariifolium TaxID=118510 RepID=A0A699H0R8_TANCI|nr:reverse transcriptase domain-containing protein [Tanacetum cinerariifolium]
MTSGRKVTPRIGRTKARVSLQPSMASTYVGNMPSNDEGDVLSLMHVGFTTTFVRWIEDYPLPDCLKMPTHIALLEKPYTWIEAKKWLRMEHRLNTWKVSIDLRGTLRGAIQETRTRVVTGSLCITKILTTGSLRVKKPDQRGVKVREARILGKRYHDRQSKDQDVHSMREIIFPSVIDKEPSTDLVLIKELLQANVDVFVWSYADMKGVPRKLMIDGNHFGTKHKLTDYNDIQPIKQKRRGLAPERNVVACKEVKELTIVGIL